MAINNGVAQIPWSGLVSVKRKRNRYDEWLTDATSNVNSVQFGVHWGNVERVDASCVLLQARNAGHRCSSSVPIRFVVSSFVCLPIKAFQFLFILLPFTGYRFLYILFRFRKSAPAYTEELFLALQQHVRARVCVCVYVSHLALEWMVAAVSNCDAKTNKQ